MVVIKCSDNELIAKLAASCASGIIRFPTELETFGERDDDDAFTNEIIQALLRPLDASLRGFCG